MKIIFQESNITVLQSERGEVNTTVLEYQNYLIVIDTMYVGHDLLNLKKFLLNLKKPVRFIINTHFHFDHFWGNKSIADTNTVIIGHKNFIRTATSRVKSQKEQDILLSKNRFPDITFYKTLCLENLHLFHSPGHSADSIFIYSPQNKILIAGDTVLGKKNDIKFIPYFVEGTLSQIRNSLEQIMHFNTKIIIPGHFGIVEKNEIKKDLAYLSAPEQNKAVPNVHDELYKKIHTENLKKINRGK